MPREDFPGLGDSGAMKAQTFWCSTLYCRVWGMTVLLDEETEPLTSPPVCPVCLEPMENITSLREVVGTKRPR